MPWTYSVAVPGYTEAVNDAATAHDDTQFNDSATNPPRAILNGNGIGVNGSDVLVIKSVNVARNDPSRKSTRLISTAPYVRTWTPADENLVGTDRVIVIRGGAGTSLRELVTGASLYTTYASVTGAPWLPSDATDNRIVYGINESTVSVPRTPFNRADYYIRRPDNIPSQCANNVASAFFTKELLITGWRLTELPLLDCMQNACVTYNGDDFENGVGGDAFTNSLAGLTAVQIRTRVKAVEVYILAHEGQRDPNFRFANFTAGACGATCDRVGRSDVLGRDFDLAAITDYLNYRWKIYTIVVKPENLRRE